MLTLNVICVVELITKLAGNKIAPVVELTNSTVQPVKKFVPASTTVVAVLVTTPAGEAEVIVGNPVITWSLAQAKTPLPLVVNTCAFDPVLIGRVKV